eukprot:m.288753 g.288753  ORF g.288753 m.288753 type:complete len:86 (-) comp27099_c0_seq8:431-688(-)
MMSAANAGKRGKRARRSAPQSDSTKDLQRCDSLNPQSCLSKEKMLAEILSWVRTSSRRRPFEHTPITPSLSRSPSPLLTPLLDIL